jgi:hypothetical protein
MQHKIEEQNTLHGNMNDIPDPEIDLEQLYQLRKLK